MASNDKKFEIVYPTSWDRLMHPSFEVADKDLLNPTISGKVPLMDGEFLQENSQYKLIRADTPAAPSYAWMEWRGDLGVQGAGKGAILRGGTYEADTVIYDATSLVLHSPLMVGTVTIAGQARSGLVLRTGSNFIVGYVTKLAASNNGRLRFLATGV